MGKKPTPGVQPRALLRVTEAWGWKLDHGELVLVDRVLRRDGCPVHIEPKPLNLLFLFLETPRVLVTKEELIERLWDGRVVSESVISSCVNKLRAALGPHSKGWITAVHGYGYRFEAPAERFELSPQQWPAPSMSMVSAANTVAPAPERPAKAAQAVEDFDEAMVAGRKLGSAPASVTVLRPPFAALARPSWGILAITAASLLLMGAMALDGQSMRQLFGDSETCTAALLAR